MNRPSHLASLDGLRGLAILLVIAHNVQMLEAPIMATSAKAAYFLMDIGWVGVQLFFVLSGFLITGILLDTVGKPNALGKFIARRTLRIFPLYYGALFLLFALLPWLNMQPAIYKADVPYQGWLWSYLSNWPLSFGPGAGNLPHFWSLAVEEQFYLVWPLLVLSLRSPAKVAMACVLFAIVGPVSRALVLGSGLPHGAAYAWTHCRIDALALGGLAATVWRTPSWAEWVKRHASGIVAIMALVVIGGAVWTHGFPRTSPKGMIVGYSVLAIFFAGVIYAAANLDAKSNAGGTSPIWHRLLTSSKLALIGKYSYGMYVFHKPLHDLFSADVLARFNFHPEGDVLRATVHLTGVVLASFLAAWVSYNLYEVHFLKLKRYFV